MNYKIFILTILAFTSITTSAQSEKYWVDADLSGSHILAIRNDGTLWSQGGYNVYGELGNGTYTGEKRTSIKIKNKVALYKDKVYRKEIQKIGDENKAIKEKANNRFMQVGTDTDWKMVWTMTETSLALKTDGTLWAWGNNEYGILGDSVIFSANHPQQVGTDRWLKIAVGDRHIVALRSDSTLWTWGNNKYGQLGDGTKKQSCIPLQVGGNSRWRDITAGAWFSAGITADGLFVAWGNVHYEPTLVYGNSFAQTITLSLLTDAIRNKRTEHTDKSQNWTRVAAGSYHTLIINDRGELWAMGSNLYNQVGDSSEISRKNFVLIDKSRKWIDLAPFAQTSNALDENHDGWTWGKGGNVSIKTPTLRTMKDDSQIKWKRLVPRGAIDSDNNLWSWRFGFPFKIDCPQ